MEQIWRYSIVGGGDTPWSLVDHPVTFIEGADCDKEIEASGFSKFDRFGGEDGFDMVEVWQRDPGHGDRVFLVVWSTAEGVCPELLASDLPSLLGLLKLLASVSSSRDILEKLTHFEMVLGKAFHAWHGHSVYEMCSECDRDGYAALQESRRRRRAEKEARADS